MLNITQLKNKTFFNVIDKLPNNEVLVVPLAWSGADTGRARFKLGPLDRLCGSNV